MVWETQDGHPAGVSGTAYPYYATAVQDAPELRAVQPSHRVDKQQRLVEDAGTAYWYDLQGVGVDDGDLIIKPTDISGDGRWYKIVPGGTPTPHASSHEGGSDSLSVYTDHVQVIYVGKHGNDANSGKTLHEAKETFGAAQTAAGTPANDAAAVALVCLDDGVYTEDLTHTPYVYVYAPNATFVGFNRFSSAGKFRLAARKLENSGVQAIVAAQNTAVEAYVEVEEVSVDAAVAAVAVTAGILRLKAGKVASTGVDGGACLSVATGEARLDVEEMVIEGGNCIGVSVTNSGKVTGRAGYIHGDEVGISCLQGNVNLVVGELETTDVAVVVNHASAEVNLVCPKITGTVTETAGTLRINQSPRVIRTSDDIKVVLEAAADYAAFVLEPGLHPVSGGPVTIDDKRGISITGPKGAIVERSDDQSETFLIKGGQDFTMEGFTIRADLTGSDTYMLDIDQSAGSFVQPTRHRYANLHFEVIGAGKCSGVSITGDFLFSDINNCAFTGRLDNAIKTSSIAGDERTGSQIRNNVCETSIAAAFYAIIAHNESPGVGFTVRNNRTKGAWAGGILCSSQNSEDIMLVHENIIVDPSGPGINAGTTTSLGLDIVANLIYNPTFFGIALEGSASNIAGNQITYSSGKGIKVTNLFTTEHVTVTGNLILHAQEEGISFAGVFSDISDNMIVESDKEGVKIENADAEYVSVNDNFLYKCGDSGALFDSISTPAGATHIDVSDNTVYYPIKNGIVCRSDSSDISDNIVAYGDFGGIILIGASGCSIDGNIARDNYDGYGIDIDVDSDNNKVFGNVLDSNASGPIRNLGTDNEIDGKLENITTTSNAAVTTISTIAIPDDAATLVEVSVVAFRTNGADQAVYKKAALVHRRSAGVATLEGAVQDVFTDVESDATWDATITVSGNTALVRVTGAVGKDVNWKSRHTVESVG